MSLAAKRTWAGGCGKEGHRECQSRQLCQPASERSVAAQRSLGLAWPERRRPTSHLQKRQRQAPRLPSPPDLDRLLYVLDVQHQGTDIKEEEEGRQVFLFLYTRFRPCSPFLFAPWPTPTPAISSRLPSRWLPGSVKPPKPRTSLVVRSNCRQSCLLLLRIRSMSALSMSLRLLVR